MGAQDNGNSFRVQGTEWRETTTGDGFSCVFHPSDTNVVFASTQNQNVQRSTDGGQTFRRAVEGLTEALGKQATFGTNFAWTSNPFRLFTNTRRKIWVTLDNGDSWAEVAQSLPLTHDIQDFTVSADGTRVAILDGRGGVWVSTDSGANFTKNGDVPATNVARIRIDRADTNKLYVATREPRAERQRLWTSPDNGATWTAISRSGEANGLPDVPLNAIEVDLKDANVLWAGSFIGLYRSGDGGQTWTRHGQGLPNVPIMTIALLPDGSRVRIGTFGRGVWEVSGAAASSAAAADPSSTPLAVPVARFSFTPANPRPGESVEFKDESTGAPSAWAWTFGDNGTASTPEPSHVFSGVGTYKVTLKITTSQGTFETSQNIAVAKPNTDTGDELTYLLPIVLTSGGSGGTSYSSELTLTNRTSSDLALRFTAKGTAAGNEFESSATYTLKPGQLVKPDAFAFLKSIGMSIPADDQILASVRVAVKGTDEISGFGAQVRVTTPPNAELSAKGVKGKFGLAYVATPLTRGANREAIVYGLQQGSSSRSNLACVHAGGSTDPITLEVTYYDGTTRKAHPTKDERLTTFAPFEWKQSGQPLSSSGRSIATGSAVIKKTSGTGQFVCYGVLNDQRNGDGSFVPMVVNDVEKTTSQAFVPVVLEAAPYKSEVTLTNRDRNKLTGYITLVLYNKPADPEYVAFELEAGEQVVIDNVMEEFRAAGVVLPPNPIGSLFIEFEQWSDPEGTDEGGVEISVNHAYAGVRTSDASGVADGKGQFGLSYGYTPVGEMADLEAWIFGLQQTGEKGVTDGSRSNLAVVNAGGVDELDIEIEVSYFGPDGALLGQQENCKPCTLKPGEWRQWGEVLKPFGVTDGYARIRKVSGTDQFTAYGVLNDQLNNDGSFVPMTIP
jgi:PKD repeat protein